MYCGCLKSYSITLVMFFRVDELHSVDKEYNLEQMLTSSYPFLHLLSITGNNEDHKGPFSHMV